MNWLPYLADFAAGLFICNGLPHLAAGLRGEPFPTPFAKPPGEGLSSPMTNTLWGTLNLIVGWALLAYAPLAIDFSVGALLFWVGFLLMGCMLARHFGTVRDKHLP